MDWRASFSPNGVTFVPSAAQCVLLSIIEKVLQALGVAVLAVHHVAGEIDGVLASWNACMHESAGSAMLRMPEILVEQPVWLSAILQVVWALRDVHRRIVFAVSVSISCCIPLVIADAGNAIRLTS